MADEAQTAPQPNEPEARTPTGEILDQRPDSLAGESSPTTTPPADGESSQSLAADAKPGEAEASKDSKTPPTVPEKYEFKAPEGFEYRAERIEEASKVFKEIGLSQEQANKVMALAGSEIAAAMEEPYNAYQSIRDGWRKDIIANAELGNGKDGLNDATRADITAVKNFLGPELRAEFEDAMNFTGAGDHPAFLKVLKAVAKAVGEGKPVTGTPVNSGEKKPSIAQAIYPNLPSAAR